jgi:hypothetical protein
MIRLTLPSTLPELWTGQAVEHSLVVAFEPGGERAQAGLVAGVDDGDPRV